MKRSSKTEIIAQLDSARWQISRDAREFGDDLAHKLSVKGQIQRSFRASPSAWGLGFVGLGFLATRLVVRKKELPKGGKPTYNRKRAFLPQLVKAQAVKTLVLAFEPFLNGVVKDRNFISAPKPPSPHV